MKKPDPTHLHPKPPEDNYLPGDDIPVGDAIERDTDSAWAMWQDSTQEVKRSFEETVPMALEEMPPIPKR